MSDITKDIERLVELNREAHEAIKDLSRLLKEAKEYQRGVQTLIDSSIKDIKVTVDEIIGDVVEVGLAAYEQKIMEAIDGATDRIYARFDSLGDIILGEMTPQDQTLEMQIRGWMKRRPPKVNP